MAYKHKAQSQVGILLQSTSAPTLKVQIQKIQLENSEFIP